MVELQTVNCCLKMKLDICCFITNLREKYGKNYRRIFLSFLVNTQTTTHTLSLTNTTGDQFLVISVEREIDALVQARVKPNLISNSPLCIFTILFFQFFTLFCYEPFVMYAPISKPLHQFIQIGSPKISTWLIPMHETVAELTLGARKICYRYLKLQLFLVRKHTYHLNQACPFP